MSKKEIRQYNDQRFFDDLKKATSVMVYASSTGTYLSIMKKELLNEARNLKVSYYMTNDVFKVRRLVMVVV